MLQNAIQKLKHNTYIAIVFISEMEETSHCHNICYITTFVSHFSNYGLP